MNKVLKKQGSNPSQFKLATRERLYVVFGEKKTYMIKHCGFGCSVILGR